MSLVFAALTPYSPVLVPSIGKENINNLSGTIQAFKRLKNKLKKNKVDEIIIISSNDLSHDEKFIINFNPQFVTDYKDFGDFSNIRKFEGGNELAQKLRGENQDNFLLQLISQEKIDYKVSIPLYYLTSEKDNYKILPIYDSGLSYESHFNFGKSLRSAIFQSSKKIAIIASGELSNVFDKNSVTIKQKAKNFDKKIIQYLENKKISHILDLDQEPNEEVYNCDLKSLLILLGIIDDLNYQSKVLSYEASFNIGFLSMEFYLN